MLHDNKEIFEQAVLKTAEFLNIEPAIIEKDYYVTLFLRELSEKRDDIVFKGGTSLSKCYGIIKRFSEDIDLNVKGENKPTEGERRALKRDIESVIDKLSFRLANDSEIFSRRDFNKYLIEYPVTLGASYLKSQIIVETAVFFRAYPNEKRQVTNYIYDYLKENNSLEYADKWDLTPFDITVQSAERTLIDKIYAIGDYYLSGNTLQHSRHIYDIYKLESMVKFDGNLRKLADDVRAERVKHKTCLSAQSEVDMNKLLSEIVNKDVFKSDYESVTASLLFENVGYDEVLKSLKRIIEENIF